MRQSALSWVSSNVFRVFSCLCLWGWRTQIPVRRQWMWVCREGMEGVWHPDLRLPPRHPRSSTPSSPPLWSVGGIPEFARGADWLHRPSAGHFPPLTRTHAAWSANKHTLVTIPAFIKKKEVFFCVMCVFFIPQSTQALSTVVKLRGSHTNTLVQLLQQDTTYLLHLLKIWEGDNNLWRNGVAPSY